LHRRPKVVCIEETGEFRVDIDHMDIAFAAVANDSSVEITSLIRLNINS
jgi:hypothetical protein